MAVRPVVFVTVGKTAAEFTVELMVGGFTIAAGAAAERVYVVVVTPVAYCDSLPEPPPAGVT